MQQETRWLRRQDGTLFKIGILSVRPKRLSLADLPPIPSEQTGARMEETEQNGTTLDGEDLVINDGEPAILNTIQVFEANADEIDYLGFDLTAFEESNPYFKGITEHSHQQLMLDLREYARAVREALSQQQAAEEAAQNSDTQQPETR